MITTLILSLMLQIPGTIDWTCSSHPDILKVEGAPSLIETPLGAAMSFDGKDDGIFLDSVPVKDMEEFTVELIFRQNPNSSFEQRFLHMGAYSGARIMFESRVTEENEWYFDAFVHLGSKEKSCVLIDSELTHPCGKWYNLTLTVSRGELRSYVDGVLQCRSDFKYEPAIKEGQTSLGVRQNLVCWFDGAIYRLRVTPKVLSPEEFIRDQEKLNGTQSNNN